MEIKFLKEEKNEIEFEIPNLTMAEILRVYLNQDSEVDFVAWKREHYTKNPILKVITRSKDAKTIVKQATESITKDLDSINSDFKNLK